MLQRAITLKNLTSVSAGGVFPKVDMNINVLMDESNLSGVNQVEMIKASSK